jgi:hypothetical protein
MAGRGTISVNQTPTYGDKSKLAAASKTLTKTPMTGTPTPAPTAGRPVSTGAGSSQTGNTQPTGNTAPLPQQSRVAPEHKEAFKELAVAFRTHQFWQNVLAQYPSDWSRMYAKEAKRNYEQTKQKTRGGTPYFL